jgi:myo-inositol 2-dehydrogenase/D-chiro-inositol 1-dehydrogenase
LIVLRFGNGVIGTIDNSRRAAYGYDQRVEVLGSKGKIATENCFPNQAVVSTGQSVYSDLPLNFFMERYQASFTSELASFVAAVLEDKQTAVTGQDGRVPVLMAIAARKSFDERRPVRLDEIAAKIAA